MLTNDGRSFYVLILDGEARCCELLLPSVVDRLNAELTFAHIDSFWVSLARFLAAHLNLDDNSDIAKLLQEVL